MNPNIYRRVRRQPASREAASFNKDKQQEQSFFGEPSHELFFRPSNIFTPLESVQRKCENCEKEEKQVQRAEDNLATSEEEKVQKKEKAEGEEDKIQMKEKPDQEEEKVQKKDEELQRKEAGVSAQVNPGKYINSLAGKGNSLSAQSRSFFSARMGYDFRNVKIHTGKEAADSAKVLNAKAYTVGNNIVFNQGQYNQESNEGKRLLAHELTHVMQQNPDNMVSRKSDSEEQEKEKPTIPTFSERGVIEQNTRHFADCNGVTVEGHADANYGNSFSAPGSSSPGKDCAECSTDDCVTNSGTVISVFTTNPQITLPSVPSGLNECEQKAVQKFINTTLKSHEQQHVAAFNKYRGTVKTKYTYRGCADGLDAYTQQIHDNIEAARKAKSDTESAALDANGANIFSVTCKCPDPEPEEGKAKK